MPEILPTLNQEEHLCSEVQGEPAALIVFGASGDLTRRKLIESLFQLFRRGLLSEKFYFLGCGRTHFTDEDFRKIASDSINVNNGWDEVTNEQIEKFLSYFHFVSGGYDDPEFYDRLTNKILELDEKYSVPGCKIFYLAVPPLLYPVITERLGKANLSSSESRVCKLAPRLIIEKPFGTDLQSSIELNQQIAQYFHESQIYRIDHYLGKETVQNILMLRFANAIFEPLWNRNYVDHIQITISESLGVGSRAGYYDKSGAMRDMFQNHMLGMLSFVAMEAPSAFDAEHIRDEKVKLLNSIRPFDLDRLDETIVPGRYASGRINGETVPGYLQEKDIPADSNTETFVAAKLFIDNWRWKDVPFYLRTGKRLAKRVTEIAITFKTVPHSMFESAGLEELPPNVLVLKIQPNEGIRLSFQAKHPGSKACMSTLTMNFNYSEVFGTSSPEAYQRLLLDTMIGDQTLFNRQDDVQACWKLVTPILEKWEKEGIVPYDYPAGSDENTFKAADDLIQSDGRRWRKLSEM